MHCKNRHHFFSKKSCWFGFSQSAYWMSIKKKCLTYKKVLKIMYVFEAKWHVLVSFLQQCLLRPFFSGKVFI